LDVAEAGINQRFDSGRDEFFMRLLGEPERDVPGYP